MQFVAAATESASCATADASAQAAVAGSTPISRAPAKRRTLAAALNDGTTYGLQLAGAVALAVVLPGSASAGAALLVLHLRAKPSAGHGGRTVTVTQTASPSGTPSTPSTSPTQTATAQTPDQVVNAFFAAINNHQYHLAWRIDEAAHSVSGTFANFKAGYADTQSDTLTYISVSGNVATVKFNATHTDGTVQVFQGTYTVQDGKLVEPSHIVRIS